MAMIVFLVLTFSGSLNDFSDGCNMGFYGETCSKKCPNFCHDNECNVTTGKCLSCVKGHYSDNTKNCVPCPEHCTACSSDKFCFACNSGYRGEVCENKCTDCRPKTSCDKNTGYCFENCSEGQSGELCNTPCDSKCKSCDRHNQDQCISCADDENGDACKEECFNKCLRNTCNESNSSCTEECLSGYMTDKTCNRTCLSYCKDRCNNRCKELVQQNSSSTSTTNIGLIVGLVFGSIVIGISIAVYIIVRRRCIKRRYGRKNSSDRTHDQENTLTTQDDETIELLLPLEVIRETETRELPSAEKLIVLQMQETFSAIEKKYGNMKISVDRNNVTVEGDTFDIENAFKEISIKCHNIEHVLYEHSKSREWLNFFQKKQIVEHVKRKLEQKQLLGIWYINGTELTVFVKGKGNTENFKNTLLESVLEILVPVDKSFSGSEWLGEFFINIRRKFPEKVDICTQKQQDMVIICTDDVVKQITTMVSEFMEGITDAIFRESGVCEFVSKYWTQGDFDEIRKCGVMIKTEVTGFKLRGILNDVTKGKMELNKKINGILSKQHVLKRTGLGTVLESIKHSGTICDIETECRCVIKLPQEIVESPSKMMCDHDVIDSDILEENQDTDTNTSPKCFQTRRHKIKVQLIQGDICHQTADIIVVGVARNIDLRRDSAFLSLFNQGGAKLQIDYNRHYPNGIQDGEVAVIDSGDFSCDKIYLTSLPPWQQARCNGEKILRNFMRECLRLADKYDKKTIAFSSMVTGVYLGYPVELAVSIMYGAVIEFDSSYSKTSIKEINIIEDDETLKTYRMCHLKTQGKETRNKRMFVDGGTILIKPEEDSKVTMVKDGCAIDPIQLQVQVGDILNNTADAIVMRVGAQCSMKEQDLKKDGIIITPNDDLEIKYTINVQFQDSLGGWRAKLVDCLEAASKKSIQSIAFPLLESVAEPKAFSPHDIGACLFAAIDDFTSRNPVSSVTDVRLVVPESNAGCIPAIIAALQARTTAVNFRWGIGKIFKSQLGCGADYNQFNESSITVYSDATTNIDSCIKALDDRIGLEFATKVVDVDRDVISSLKVEEIKCFIDSDILIDVKFDEQASKFTIVGPLRNVMAAVTCLHNKMRQYNSAKVMYDQIKWQCADKLALEGEFPYDMMSNFVIETAYREGQQTVELQSKDGKIYVIDFQKLVEYPKANISDTVMVIRKDVLKEISYFGTNVVDIKTFVLTLRNIMTSDSIERVTLKRDAKYKKVEDGFLADVRNGINRSKVKNNQSVEIVKIERIKNKILCRYYQAKKKMMKEQKGRKLWHDTDEQNILRIISNGFNRSYCGVHELSYGQGVYFAADASYSAHSYLAENKPGAKRYMFLAKVLTGKLIKGDPSMRVLPPVNPAEPTITYDSAVDDINNPMEFVIFHVTQAYPKYLITYKFIN